MKKDNYQNRKIKDCGPMADKPAVTCRKSIKLRDFVRGIIYFIPVFLFCFSSVTPVFAQLDEIDELIRQSTDSAFFESSDAAYFESSLVTNENSTDSTKYINKFLSASPSAETAFSYLGLPKPLILPDSSFYFLVTWYEKVRFLLTFKTEEKAKLAINFAETRLAEAYKLAEKNKFDLALQSLRTYQDDMVLIKANLQLVSQGGSDVLALVQKMEAGSVKAQEVGEFVKSKIPNGSEDLLNSLSVLSAEGVRKALEIVADLHIATPSYELQNKVKKIIEDKNVQDKLKNDLIILIQQSFKSLKIASSSAEENKP